MRFSVEFFSLFVEFQCLKTVVRNEDLPPAGQSGSAWLQACHPSMIEISCPGVCRSSSIHRCFRRHMTVNSHQPRICQSQVSHPGASKPLNLKGFKAERDHSLSLKWFTFSEPKTRSLSEAGPQSFRRPSGALALIQLLSLLNP